VFLSHHLGVQNIVAASAEQKPSTTPSWDIWNIAICLMGDVRRKGLGR